MIWKHWLVNACVFMFLEAKSSPKISKAAKWWQNTLYSDWNTGIFCTIPTHRKQLTPSPNVLWQNFSPLNRSHFPLTSPICSSAANHTIIFNHSATANFVTWQQFSFSDSLCSQTYIALNVKIVCNSVKRQPLTVLILAWLSGCSTGHHLLCNYISWINTHIPITIKI